MLMIAICEDIPYVLQNLKQRVARHLEAKKIAFRCYGYESGEQCVLAGHCFDLILMDIKLSGMDGMETIRLLRQKGHDSQVIFITSDREQVFCAFDVDALHYLIKPVSDRDLFQAVDKAIKRRTDDCHQALTITKGSVVQRIPFHDILYCEAINHKICIHTVDSQTDFYGKLDHLSLQLDDRFFRCHRSFIVNLHYVSAKEQDFARLTNGDKVLISRRKKTEFTNQLLTFLQSEVPE